MKKLINVYYSLYNSVVIGEEHLKKVFVPPKTSEEIS